MGRLLFLLIVIAGVAYSGLYIHYGMAVEQAMHEQLDDYGLSALEIERIDYGPLAPVSTEATVTADVLYRGAEASVTIRVDGHPLFSDEMHLELEGLRALRLLFGPGD